MRDYIDSNDVVLFIKRVNKPTTPDTQFRTVVCLESLNQNLQRALREIRNQCTGQGREGVAGLFTGTVDFSGDTIDTGVLATEVGHKELRAMIVAGEQFEWKMANASGTEYLAGSGTLSNFSSTVAMDTNYKFSATLEILGMPVTEDPEA